MASVSNCAGSSTNGTRVVDEPKLTLAPSVAAGDRVGRGAGRPGHPLAPLDVDRVELAVGRRRPSRSPRARRQRVAGAARIGHLGRLEPGDVTDRIGSARVGHVGRGARIGRGRLGQVDGKRLPGCGADARDVDRAARPTPGRAWRCRRDGQRLRPACGDPVEAAVVIDVGGRGGQQHGARTVGRLRDDAAAAKFRPRRARPPARPGRR